MILQAGFYIYDVATVFVAARVAVEAMKGERKA
jgi:hypothetical protein